jgi:hypothetical protein
MIGLSDWVQSNWFQLGSLLVQLGVLATLAWYGSSILRIIRAWDEAQPRVALPEAADDRYESGLAGAWHSVLWWLQAPMGSGGPGPFRRVVRWLQAPMGS